MSFPCLHCDLSVLGVVTTSALNRLSSSRILSDNLQLPVIMAVESVFPSSWAVLLSNYLDGDAAADDGNDSETSEQRRHNHLILLELSPTNAVEPSIDDDAVLRATNMHSQFTFIMLREATSETQRYRMRESWEDLSEFFLIELTAKDSMYGRKARALFWSSMWCMLCQHGSSHPEILERAGKVAAGDLSCDSCVDAAGMPSLLSTQVTCTREQGADTAGAQTTQSRQTLYDLTEADFLVKSLNELTPDPTEHLLQGMADVRLVQAVASAASFHTFEHALTKMSVGKCATVHNTYVASATAFSALKLGATIDTFTSFPFWGRVVVGNKAAGTGLRLPIATVKGIPLFLVPDEDMYCPAWAAAIVTDAAEATMDVKIESLVIKSGLTTRDLAPPSVFLQTMDTDVATEKTADETVVSSVSATLQSMDSDVAMEVKTAEETGIAAAPATTSIDAKITFYSLVPLSSSVGRSGLVLSRMSMACDTKTAKKSQQAVMVGLKRKAKDMFPELANAEDTAPPSEEVSKKRKQSDVPSAVAHILK